MGLDTVELVMAIEEEFGIEIPDRDAEKIYTVGDTYEYLKKKLRTIPSKECATQKMFYKIRRAVSTAYDIPRRSITLNTKLSEWMPRAEAEMGWQLVKREIGVDNLEFENPYNSNQTIQDWTMRDFVSELITAHFPKLPTDHLSDEDLWLRLVAVVARESNIEPLSIRAEHSYTRDLGMD